MDLLLDLNLPLTMVASSSDWQGMMDWSLDIMLIDAQILPQSNSMRLCFKIVSGVLG